MYMYVHSAGLGKITSDMLRTGASLLAIGLTGHAIILFYVHGLCEITRVELDTCSDLYYNLAFLKINNKMHTIISS